MMFTVGVIVIHIALIAVHITLRCHRYDHHRLTHHLQVALIIAALIIALAISVEYSDPFASASAVSRIPRRIWGISLAG